MWYPFPTCPVRATGFVPTVFISRHGLTHAGAHTPSRLGQLWLSASLNTRVRSLPWPITGFLFSQTAPLSWLITPRLTSFTCLLSCPLGWPVSGPPSTEMTGSGSHSPASFISQALCCGSSLNTDSWNGHFYFVLLHPAWNSWLVAITNIPLNYSCRHDKQTLQKRQTDAYLSMNWASSLPDAYKWLVGKTEACSAQACVLEDEKMKWT